jgi:hypothetical protein
LKTSVRRTIKHSQTHQAHSKQSNQHALHSAHTAGFRQWCRRCCRQRKQAAVEQPRLAQHKPEGRGASACLLSTALACMQLQADPHAHSYLPVWLLDDAASPACSPALTSHGVQDRGAEGQDAASGLTPGAFGGATAGTDEPHKEMGEAEGGTGGGIAGAWRGMTSSFSVGADDMAGSAAAGTVEGGRVLFVWVPVPVGAAPAGQHTAGRCLRL